MQAEHPRVVGQDGLVSLASSEVRPAIGKTWNAFVNFIGTVQAIAALLYGCWFFCTLKTDLFLTFLVFAFNYVGSTKMMPCAPFVS